MLSALSESLGASPRPAPLQGAGGRRKPSPALFGVCSRIAGLCLRAPQSLSFCTPVSLSLFLTHTRTHGPPPCQLGQTRAPQWSLNPSGASRGVPPRAPSNSGQTHSPQPSPRLVFLPLSRRERTLWVSNKTFSLNSPGPQFHQDPI